MNAFVETSAKRVAWLLNHSTLHDFEVPLIRSLGLEIYTSKLLPRSNELLSASTDYSDDFYSTLPESVLTCLNGHNFYEDSFTPEVANYLNTYCDTVIAAAFPKLLTELVRHYKGRILIRVFGREAPYNYSEYFKTLDGGGLWSCLAGISHRFWLAASFATIPEIEDSLLKTRSVILPLGIPNAYIPDKFSWQGADKKVLFVCPRIASHAFYYGKIYEEFKANLGNFPYLIAGYQPIKVDDPNVIGFASDEVYRALFKDLALMFYHSREPRHLHYHPLEAIASGMPVIYMRGGLMEMFGGQEQPGACNNYHESHEKIQRILDGDTEFIKAIQKSQLEIIKPFKWEYCRNEWQKIFLGQVLTS